MWIHALTHLLEHLIHECILALTDQVLNAPGAGCAHKCISHLIAQGLTSDLNCTHAIACKDVRNTIALKAILNTKV